VAFLFESILSFFLVLFLVLSPAKGDNRPFFYAMANHIIQGYQDHVVRLSKYYQKQIDLLSDESPLKKECDRLAEEFEQDKKRIKDDFEKKEREICSVNRVISFEEKHEKFLKMKAEIRSEYLS
jgi:hypothetical protein